MNSPPSVSEADVTRLKLLEAKFGDTWVNKPYKLLRIGAVHPDTSVYCDICLALPIMKIVVWYLGHVGGSYINGWDITGPVVFVCENSEACLVRSTFS
jgi:hypothetical protein